MPWIRLQSDIAFSETLFNLDADAKWLWIFILSYSAKKMSGSFSIDESYLSHYSGVSASKIEKYLSVFLKRGLLSLNSNSSRITNESDRITNESVPNERTNERTNSIVENDFDYTHPLDLPDFDIEQLYAMYPKKEGKKKGMEKLKRIIKSRQDYENFSLAVKNYEASCIDRDKKYIKQFSSFVSVWEDYIEPEDAAYTKETLEILKRDEEKPYTNLTEIYREIVANENN